MTDRQQVALLLKQIETELQRLDLWQAAQPSAQALQSSQPFCIDTLNLNQWLQWILLPRMQALLDGGLPLPGNCGIHPIAEQNFKGLAQDATPLLDAIQAFDLALS